MQIKADRVNTLEEKMFMNYIYTNAANKVFIECIGMHHMMCRSIHLFGQNNIIECHGLK